MYSESLFNEKNNMLKKFPSDKINTTKKTLFSLSRAQTHHGFTFNSRFLYELKHRFVSIKMCVWVFIFIEI